MIEFLTGAGVIVAAFVVMWGIGALITWGDYPTFGEQMATGTFFTLLGGMMAAAFTILSFVIGSNIMGTW